MNQEKIGKFILHIRQKNKLTQKEFAGKLNVTSQAVSKWENGRGIPDIELLKTISEVFKVEISDILLGEVKKRKSSKLINISILIVLIVGAGWFLYPKADYNFLKLASTNNEFSLKGVAVYSNNKKSIYISNIEYKNLADKEEYTVVECTLYESDQGIDKKISQCGDITKIADQKPAPQALTQFLKNVEFNVDNYIGACQELTSNNLYIRINALNTQNKTITYKIPIKLEENCE